MSSTGIKQNSTEPVQEKDFLSVFKKLPEKSAVTIRFFDRGDYFSLHGSDAVYAAREFFKTNNVIKTWKWGDDELETCYVKNTNFETFLRDLLLVKQYRVEIWRRGNKSNEWIMCNHGSPGNLSQFEDVLFSSNDNDDQSKNPMCDPGLIAIQITTDDNINKLCCAFVDKTARSFQVSTVPFKDSFTDLESLVIHLGPKECLIPASGGNRDYYTKLMAILERNNVLVTERKKTEFAFDNTCDELNKLIKTSGEQNVANLIELKDKNIVGCLNSLIKYLDLLSDDENDKKFKLSEYVLNNYLKMDSGAFRSLNLLPNGVQQQQSVGNHNQRTHSVYGVLNKCCTMQGQRLLNQWIKQPLMDLHKIEERQSLVEILVEDNELRRTLTDNYLKRVPDLQKIEWRFLKKKANLVDIYKVYQAVEMMPSLLKLMSEYEGKSAHLIREMFTNTLKSIIADFDTYKKMVESTIDLKQISNHVYLILPSYCPALKVLREQLDTIEEKIELLAEKAARDLQLPPKSVKLESNAQQGYFFRISRKDDTQVRNNKSYTVLNTNKDGIRLQNDKLIEYNDKWMSIREEYEREQRTVVDDVVKIAMGYLDPMQTLNTLISQLDVLVSFAQVALSSQTEYVRPKLHPLGTGVLKLREARHPCLELQDAVNFIPNDAEFDKNTRTFCILTGPNMGGKSTYIRQIGILVLMAQIGSFVPASSAELSIVDCILARIGANDCQNKGVSTFMAEMLETSFILKTATENSLVIIDELGRGTSTYDGFGLAWAISEFLAKKIKCFTLFATHFHELTALSEEISTVFNSHVTAMTSDDTLTLLYKVRPGVCDQSFGIHVAKLANFPEHVIQYAREKAKFLEDYCPLLSGDDNNTANNDQDDQVSKKYKYKQETDNIIEKCFAQIEQMGVTGDNDEEYVKRVHELIESESLNSQNPYFKMLVKRL